ncbi:MAG TPA: transcription termination/antitermination protein NusG [Eubacteriales bacterium]|jgi:transcriptional antiterminator NusG|nr:transcription termination/antitermination protein NusG [Eubacteriales bacterium]HRU84899.1 transcription termination/antitermination protein NusG [Eubacteriales bacterium]
MDNNEAMWYVLHTYSGYEGIVEDNLRNMVENNNLQNYIFEVKVPVEDDVIEKNGKKKVVQRRKFPSYVFIKMIYTSRIWYYVTQTRGVTGFVGPGGRPQPLDADEVKRMGLEIIDVADFNIKVGDNVQIVSGPLEKFVGVVESISGERQKVKVIVSMFGRQTPVELDFSQVERM